MKKTLFLASVSALFALNAFGVSCGTVASPTGSCSIATAGGIISFSNFSFVGGLGGGAGVPGGGAAYEIPASALNIDVTLSGNGGATITFSPGNGPAWSYTGTQLYDLNVFFDVTSSNAPITNAVAFVTDTFTGSGGAGQQGSTSLTKSICNPGTPGGAAGCRQNPASISTANVNDLAGTPNTTATYTGSTAPPFSKTAISVQDKINFSANNNTLNVLSFGDTFNSVPEPMTLSLMGLGLLAVGAFGRRRFVK